MFKLFTGFIVNECGNIISVMESLGNDGRCYKEENGSIVSIAEDGEITGQFDKHTDLLELEKLLSA